MSWYLRGNKQRKKMISSILLFNVYTRKYINQLRTYGVLYNSIFFCISFYANESRMSIIVWLGMNWCAEMKINFFDALPTTNYEILNIIILLGRYAFLKLFRTGKFRRNNELDKSAQWLFTFLHPDRITK